MESKVDNLKKTAYEELLSKVEDIKSVEQENIELKNKIKKKTKENTSSVKEIQHSEKKHR